MNKEINNNKTAISRENIEFLEVGGTNEEAMRNIYSRLYNISYVNNDYNPYKINFRRMTIHDVEIIFDVEVETTMKVFLGKIRDIYSKMPGLEKISDDYYIIYNEELGRWQEYIGEDTLDYLILNIRFDNKCYLQVLSEDELKKELNPNNQIDLDLLGFPRSRRYINHDILEDIKDEYIRLSNNPNITLYLGNAEPKKVLIFVRDMNYNGKEVEIGDLLVFSDYNDTGYVVSQYENREIHKRIIKRIFGHKIEMDRI